MSHNAQDSPPPPDPNRIIQTKMSAVPRLRNAALNSHTLSLLYISIAE